MRLVRVLLTLLLSIAGSALTASVAHADDIYRYWSYSTVENGAFVPAQTGPADATPQDGGIEGYRYAAPADFTKPNLPRADLDEVTFETVCADADAADGEKRVAVLIDFGVEQDAADGETIPEPQALCAVVPTDANGLQVLESVAEKVRTEPGGIAPLLCGINDYPTTGCADQKADAGTPADETVEFVIAGDAGSTAGDQDGDGGSDDSNLPLLIGAGVVVVLVTAGGLYLSRRRSA